MTDRRDKPWDARLAFLLVYPLRDTAVTPNHLTTIRLGFGILAGAGLAHGGYGWSLAGAACFAISNFLDHADGELARISGKMSRFGHFYDLASDACVNVLLFAGIGIGQARAGMGAIAVPMGLLAGIAVAGIFQMRYTIEQSVGKNDARQPNIGVIEAEDVLYLLPLVALAGQLMPFLLLAAIGAPLFAIRVYRDYVGLRSTGRT
jgi:phosphatidylglycerophosphate synthase